MHKLRTLKFWMPILLLVALFGIMYVNNLAHSLGLIGGPYG